MISEIAHAAPERFAWILGEEAYPNARLRTVASDARAMERVLTQGNWRLEPMLLDADSARVDDGFKRLLQNIRAKPGAQVFIYLSGHGVEDQTGAGLLIPDVDGTSAGSYLALGVQSVLDALDEAGASMAVVVFDACREAPIQTMKPMRRPKTAANPLKRSGRPMERLVLYATASGTTARDGIEAQGRFVTGLIAALGLDGMTVQEAFERARAQTWDQTNGAQRPEMSVSAGGVLFAGPPIVPDVVAIANATEGSSEQPEPTFVKAMREFLLSHSDGGRASGASIDALTDEDITEAIRLVLPPRASSAIALERLIDGGSAWAAILQSLSLRSGELGITHPDRARQIADQLERSGARQRLFALHRAGSLAGTTALALFLMAVDPEKERKQATALIRSAAQAGYEPARHVHLIWSSGEPVMDNLSLEIEASFNSTEYSNDSAAHWSLAMRGYMKAVTPAPDASMDERAMARTRAIMAMKPYVDSDIPLATSLTLMAALEPRLGPLDYATADTVCAQARRRRISLAIFVCAESWAGEDAARNNPRRALEWMREAADLGLPSAGNQAGRWLSSGVGGRQDAKAAFRYWRECADRGQAQCMINAADALQAGRGTKRDVHAAADLYRKAVKVGNNWAPSRLAALLREEPSIEREPGEIVRYLVEGMDRGDSQAWVGVGIALRDGNDGLPRRTDLARRAFLTGAEMGNANGWTYACDLLIEGSEGKDAIPAWDCLRSLEKDKVESASFVLAARYSDGRHVQIDRVNAFRIYTRLADEGYTHAIAMLGQFHEYGWAGLAIDPAAARRLYEQAANNGSVWGSLFLGRLQLEYPASLKDQREGIHRMEEGVLIGNPMAQWLLGHELMTGQYITLDRPRAETLLRSSVAAGSIDGQYELAVRLLRGDGIRRSVDEARALLEDLAINRGHLASMNRLAQAEENGEWNGPPNHDESRRWYGLAAAKNDGMAIARLGRKAMWGEGEAQDTEKAMSLYRRAIEAGSSVGSLYLGDAYAYGHGGTPVDRARALAALRKSADLRNSDAQAQLGYLLMGNAGFEQNFDQAMHFNRLAVSAGHPVAQNNLGHYLHTGMGITRDTTQAIELWTLSANAGNVMAMMNLWRVLLKGENTPPNPERAAQWLRAAAAAGDTNAQAMLGDERPD